MADKRMTLVVAMDRNRAIGRDGGLPWHLPADLRHFKRTTLGHPVVMGRQTWEEVGKPLPGRQNIVISSRLRRAPKGAELARSLDDALALARSGEVMVIGGGQIYALALPRAERLVVTHIAASIGDADTWFPPLDLDCWLGQLMAIQAVDDRHPYAFEIRDYRWRWRDDQRLCRMPRAGGRPVRLPRGEFESLRALLFESVSRDASGALLKTLMEQVAAGLPPRERGRRRWQMLRVKLELESDGLIRRANSRQGQRLLPGPSPS